MFGITALNSPRARRAMRCCSDLRAGAPAAPACLAWRADRSIFKQRVQLLFPGSTLAANPDYLGKFARCHATFSGVFYSQKHF